MKVLSKSWCLFLETLYLKPADWTDKSKLVPINKVGCWISILVCWKFEKEICTSKKTYTCFNYLEDSFPFLSYVIEIIHWRYHSFYRFSKFIGHKNYLWILLTCKF